MPWCTGFNEALSRCPVHLDECRKHGGWSLGMGSRGKGREQTEAAPQIVGDGG